MRGRYGIGDWAPNTETDVRRRWLHGLGHVRRIGWTDPNAPWRKEPASEKQIAWMEAHGYVVPRGFTKGDFSDLMEKLKSRGRRRRA